MDLISVIVPVYKVEQYLDRCVSSIVNQTYHNLEIILVDDGSPDNCPVMCDTWAEKDSRIRVIHKQNGGLSDARNAGMEIATGEYIGFVDSDDYISNNMYQLLYEHMRSDNSDISACGAQIVFESGAPSCSLTASGACVLNATQAMEAIIAETQLKQPVWYKLYKKTLIQHIPFPVGKCHEDAFWTFQVVGRANRISVFDTPCYFYVQRHNSIMNASYSLRRLDALEANCLRQQYVQTYFPSLADKALCAMWGAAMYMGQMALLHLSKKDQHITFQRINKMQKQFPLGLSKCNDLPFTQRIWLLGACFWMKGICKIRNILKIGM